MNANRLVPLIAVLVLGIFAVVIVRSFAPSPDVVQIAEPPDLADPEADTPADTIRTLTAQLTTTRETVESAQSERNALQQQLAETKRELQNLRSQITAPAATRGLADRLDRLQDDVAALSAAGRTAAASTSADFGLPDLPISTPDSPPSLDLVWIEPLDAMDSPSPDGPGQGAAALGDRAGSTISSGADSLLDRQLPGMDDGEPIYTIPRNATLMGATGFTAMIGRVPIEGVVADPVPFKLLIGADNLAANGLRVPEVHGMVVSGYGIGDWTLSCVHGRIMSITFVFDDGTIQTVSADDDAGSLLNAANNNTAPGAGFGTADDDTLGWVSDNRGIPCVPGRRITNAPAYLAQRIGLSAAEAAAASAALSETTRVVNPLGGVQSTVTGDTGAYVLGNTVSAGIDEIDDWVADRITNSYDAIFAEPGATVAVHLSEEIPIDYDPTGRRLNHLTGSSDATVRLD